MSTQLVNLVLAALNQQGVQMTVMGNNDIVIRNARIVSQNNMGSSNPQQPFFGSAPRNLYGEHGMYAPPPLDMSLMQQQAGNPNLHWPQGGYGMHPPINPSMFGQPGFANQTRQLGHYSPTNLIDILEERYSVLMDSTGTMCVNTIQGIIKCEFQSKIDYSVKYKDRGVYLVLSLEGNSVNVTTSNHEISYSHNTLCAWAYIHNGVLNIVFVRELIGDLILNHFPKFRNRMEAEMSGLITLNDINTVTKTLTGDDEGTYDADGCLRFASDVAFRMVKHGESLEDAPFMTFYIYALHTGHNGDDTFNIQLTRSPSMVDVLPIHVNKSDNDYLGVLIGDGVRPIPENLLKASHVLRRIYGDVVTPNQKEMTKEYTVNMVLDDIVHLTNTSNVNDYITNITRVLAVYGVAVRPIDSTDTSLWVPDMMVFQYTGEINTTAIAGYYSDAVNKFNLRKSLKDIETELSQTPSSIISIKVDLESNPKQILCHVQHPEGVK